MATKEIQQPAPSRPKAAPSGPNAVQRSVDEAVKYLKGVKSELKRISWPSAQELRYNTAVVVFVVAGISAYMWLVDRGLTWIMGYLHR